MTDCNEMKSVIIIRVCEKETLLLRMSWIESLGSLPQMVTMLQFFLL